MEDDCESETPGRGDQSPRKMSVVSSLKGAELKRRSIKGTRNRGRGKSTDRSPSHPFMEENEFCDTKIIVGDKIIYTNKALLAFHSPVFMKHFREGTSGSSGGKGSRVGGKSGGGAQGNKDVDLSDKKFDIVCSMMEFVDPRVDFTLTDELAFRLLPLAEEYEMRQLIRASEDTLTRSFYRLRKTHKQGCLPIDTTVQYLKVGDRFKCKDLTNMCTEECVANQSPNIVRVITECDELSEPIKLCTLTGKLDHLTGVLAKERRAKAEREVGKSTTGKSWKK